MYRHFYVTARFESSGETRELMGVTYRVVPVVLVRSQVLVNNIGRCFLPPAAITNEWAEQWNGAPIVTDHPTVGGVEISARDPDVMQAMGIGVVYHARAEDGAIKGEAWLNEARADEVEELAIILQALDDEETVEVSTGFPALGERKRGVHNGERYDIVLLPDGADHLAAFTDGVGACNNDDGCGLGVNRRESARAAGDIEFSGTEETPWADVSKDLAAFVAAYGTEDEEGASVEDLSSETRTAIAARTILGEATAETTEDLISVPVVNPGTDNLNLGALNAAAAAAGGARGADLPDPEGIQATVDSLREEHFPDGEDEDAENMASRFAAALALFARKILGNQDELSLDDIRRLVQDEAESIYGGIDTFVWVEELFQDRAIIAVEPPAEPTTYFEAPFELDEEEGAVTFTDTVEVEKVTEFVPAANGGVEARHEYLRVTPTATEAEMNRDELIQALADHESVPFSEDTLKAMSDEELAHVATNAEVDVGGDGGSGEAGGEPAGSEPADPPAEPAGNAAEGDEPPAWARELTDVVKGVAERVDRLESETEKVREDAAQERARLAGDIAANSDFEADDLEGRDLKELRKLHKAVCRKPRSFLGLGGRHVSDPSPDAEGEDLGFTVHSTMGAGVHQSPDDEAD